MRHPLRPRRVERSIRLPVPPQAADRHVVRAGLQPRPAPVLQPHAHQRHIRRQRVLDDPLDLLLPALDAQNRAVVRPVGQLRLAARHLGQRARRVQQLIPAAPDRAHEPAHRRPFVQNLHDPRAPGTLVPDALPLVRAIHKRRPRLVARQVPQREGRPLQHDPAAQRADHARDGRVRRQRRAAREGAADAAVVVEVGGDGLLAAPDAALARPDGDAPAAQVAEAGLLAEAVEGLVRGGGVGEVDVGDGGAGGVGGEAEAVRAGGVGAEGEGPGPVGTMGGGGVGEGAGEGEGGRGGGVGGGRDGGDVRQRALRGDVGRDFEVAGRVGEVGQAGRGGDEGRGRGCCGVAGELLLSACWWWWW